MYNKHFNYHHPCISYKIRTLQAHIERFVMSFFLSFERFEPSIYILCTSQSSSLIYFYREKFTLQTIPWMTKTYLKINLTDWTWRWDFIDFWAQPLSQRGVKPEKDDNIPSPEKDQ